MTRRSAVAAITAGLFAVAAADLLRAQTTQIWPTKLGVEPLIMSPADFDARIAREAPIAMTLAKAAGIAVK